MDRICYAYNLHRACCCCSVLVNYVALDRKIKTCLLGWGWFFNLTLWSLLLLLYLEGWKIFDFPDDLYWNNVILMRYWFGMQIKYHPEYYCSLSDNLWHFFLVSTSFSTALVHKYSQNLLFCAIGAKTLSKSTFSTIPTKCMGNPFALLSHDIHMCARNKNPFHAKTLSTSEFLDDGKFLVVNESAKIKMFWGHLLTSMSLFLSSIRTIHIADFPKSYAFILYTCVIG